jgi:predicted DsbA family dithiol-disulfide isomerase
MERAAYRAAKFGAHKSAELDQQMTALGRQEGIMFAFERQHRTPSTRKAHRLIAHASRLGSADSLVEALFRAYFETGLDIGDTEVLADIAKPSGLEPEQALTALQDVSLDAEVRELEHQATRAGVSGVPFFIINDTWAISGAQPAPQWIDALRDILSRPAEAGQPQPAA